MPPSEGQLTKVEHRSTLNFKQLERKKKKRFNSYDTELKDNLILIKYSRHERVRFDQP